MEKLEKQQRIMRNQYETENAEFNDYEYVRKLRTSRNLSYGITHNETISQWYPRMKAETDMGLKKNARTHVWNNGKGCWFTHEDKFGVGCFMCEDCNRQSYMMSVIEYFVNKYPNETLDI